MGRGPRVAAAWVVVWLWAAGLGALEARSQLPFEEGRVLRVAGVSEEREGGAPVFHRGWVRGSLVRMDREFVVLRRGSLTQDVPYRLLPSSRMLPVSGDSDDPVGRPVRLALNRGTTLTVGGTAYSDGFEGRLARVDGARLWVVSSSGSLPAEIERTDVREVRIRWGDPALDGLRNGAKIGAAVGLLVGLLNVGPGGVLSADGAKVVVGAPVVFAAVFAPFGLTFGALGGGDWRVFDDGGVGERGVGR